MMGTVSKFAGIYREWAPHAALRDHVRCLWTSDLTGSPHQQVQVVPDGCADIFWNGRELCVAGPDTRPILAPLPRQAVVAGVRFHPGAAAAWLGVPLNEILNQRVPLAEFWSDDARRIADQAAAQTAPNAAAALQAVLLLRLAGIEQADRRIRFLRSAAGDFRNPVPITFDRLAAQMGVSERTLRRHCIEAFGYGFKTLSRILRFQRFVRCAMESAGANLAGLAAQAGYADQAHLSREVQRMSGLTAGQFVAQIPS
jgi:AraC-like DNA-binding protein